MNSCASRDLANLIAQEACLVMSVGSLSLSHHLLREVVELANKPQWLAALWEEQKQLMEEYGPGLGRQVRIHSPPYTFSCTFSCEYIMRSVYTIHLLHSRNRVV